ncbi:MAG: DUF2062 domain-containing protein [Steroidobacteraceae bacterium]
MKNFFQTRLLAPLLSLLKQGLSPRELALCIALGAGIGLFPVLGVSTPLLTIIALARKLNLAAIQLVSYAMSPVQLVLIIPFMRLGEWAIGATPQPMTIAAGMEILATGILEAIITLWDAIIHATLGWLILGPLAIYVTYRVLIPLLERASQSLRKADEL